MNFTALALGIIAFLFREQLGVLLRQTAWLGGRRSIRFEGKKMREIFNMNDLSRMPTEPVVLRGFVQPPSLSKISRAELRAEYGGDRACVFTDTDDARSRERRHLDSVVDEIEAAEASKVYARALHDHRGLVHQSGVAECMKLWNPLAYATSWIFERGSNSSVWFLSQNNTHSEVHCDATSSAFVMVEGEKRWDFWEPTNRMLPYGQRLNLAFDSELITFPEPDMKVTIYPGDVLLFPSMWWHRV